MHWRHTLF